ncbi:hypothetical protein B296_00018358 [Ensete ventricosum]|uniref:Uncharacterized protein n=1 Tax=Ensete ventricosum TaxID=4639 RepID=A0A427AEY1_ENSVE|nr:hypothetical protein B296_00018358 [Ensete ventricosum]
MCCHIPAPFPLSTAASPLLCHRRCDLPPLQSLSPLLAYSLPSACGEGYSPTTITATTSTIVAPSPSSAVVVALCLRSAAYSLLYHRYRPLPVELQHCHLCFRSPNAAMSLLGCHHTNTVPTRSSTTFFLICHRCRPLPADASGMTKITNIATPHPDVVFNRASIGDNAVATTFVSSNHQRTSSLMTDIVVIKVVF